jgi:hypothetical protein
MAEGVTTLEVERDTPLASPRHVEEIVMHLGVIHEIRDPAGWDRVMGSKELYGHPDLPPGFAILASVTQDDAARGVCFWEAPSAAELQRLLEGAFGDAVVHDVFVVDPGRSVNLPAPQTTARA